MRTRPRHCAPSTTLERTVSGALLGVVLLAGAAVAESPMSVPAEFVAYVTPLGVLDHFERPSAIHVDTRNGEMLVADPGRNRIVIFDTDGNYRFEFSLGDRAAMPMDVAVDSEGLIYIVGSTREGRRIFRFDFDGLYVGEVPLPYLPSGQLVTVDSIDIDDHDRVVVLDRVGLRVSTLTGEGELVSTFPVMPELSLADRRQAVLGSITVSGDRIYIPFSAFGTVFVFSPDGEQVDAYGYKGNNPGQLNFPVAVEIADDLVAVLDKHRYNIVCFNRDGRFLGEFGGKGLSPGWFYHPTLLGLGPENQAYIGQIYENKVQVCRIPDFITRNRRLSATARSTLGS